MEESKKGFVPMERDMVLSKTECPSTSKELDILSWVPYASAIRSIMYAMICKKLDVSYVISMMSLYQANYGESHWTVVKNILKYLNRNKYMFLIYGGKDELSVKGYVDASFQTDRDNSRSHSVFFSHWFTEWWSSNLEKFQARYYYWFNYKVRVYCNQLSS